MSSERVIVVSICVVLTSAACGIWRQTAVSAAALGRTSGTAYLSDSTLPDRGEIYGDAVRLDQYGNEIETAIQDYRVDPAGDMYERHSPETEIMLLPPPEA